MSTLIDLLQVLFFVSFFLFAFGLLGVTVQWPGAFAGLIALVLFIQAAANSRKPV